MKIYAINGKKNITSIYLKTTIKNKQMKYPKLTDEEFYHFQDILRENLDLYSNEKYLIEYWKSEWNRRVMERAKIH